MDIKSSPVRRTVSIKTEKVECELSQEKLIKLHVSNSDEKKLSRAIMIPPVKGPNSKPSFYLLAVIYVKLMLKTTYIDSDGKETGTSDWGEDATCKLNKVLPMWKDFITEKLKEATCGLHSDRFTFKLKSDKLDRHNSRIYRIHVIGSRIVENVHDVVPWFKEKNSLDDEKYDIPDLSFELPNNKEQETCHKKEVGFYLTKVQVADGTNMKRDHFKSKPKMVLGSFHYYKISRISGLYFSKKIESGKSDIPPNLPPPIQKDQGESQITKEPVDIGIVTTKFDNSKL